MLIPLLRFGSRVMAAWWFGPAPDWPRVRARARASTRSARAPRNVSVTTGELGGVPAEILTSADSPDETAVLYLHGSGFVIGAPRMVRPLTGALAAALNTTVYALDYRLAPEHPHPAAIEDTVAAYLALVERGVRPDRIAVVGDSAGGTLAVDLALRLRDDRLPFPAVLGMICPVLDLSAASSAFHCDARREPLLTAELMRQFMDAYLPHVPEDRRRELSPIYRDITGLPPVVMHSATDDILSGDARRFADHAAKLGAPLRHREYRGLWHVFHAMPMKPAREAVDDLATALGSVLRAPRTDYRSGQ
ncbi:alpha/beta hydrolase [Nocardia sp. NPDC050406]|uniref:alpha/beta hydrolase n=1 Tax=Nocardia sp. NPDC050406 TaxID=3364318 RepID=UPI0037A2968B